MLGISKQLKRVAVAGLVSGSAALSASASVTEVVLEVEASNAAGAARATFALTGGTWNSTTSTYTWTRTEPMPLVDSNSGAPIATLRSATVYLKRASEINVNVSVEAGASTTSFLVRSPRVSFETIPTGTSRGKAYARFDLTDLNNDGAAFSGLGTPGTGGFHAGFNGAYPAGGEFSHLVAQVSCGPGGSGYGQQSDPIGEPRDMNADVSELSIYLGFSLTAGDRCNAVTRFDVNPDPTG